MTEPACEVCGKPVEKSIDLLCEDCSNAFTILLELLHTHPDLTASSLDRIGDVFEWRAKKTDWRRAETKPAPLSPQG